MQPLQIGEALVPLMQSSAGEFMGLGGITIAGTALRSGRRPFTVHLDTPDGIQYARFKVRKVVQTGPSATVDLDAIGWPGEYREYQDDHGQATLALREHLEPVVDRLLLRLAPVALKLAGRYWTGFSYSFQFTSSRRRIHRLLTHATWEIGGRITGNTVLHQGQCNMPVYRGARKHLFTTACLRTLADYGKAQGNSFQLGPRAGLVQGFDFQYAAAGALLQYWPRFASISSLLESPPASDLLHVVDEYRFKLASHATTPAKWVLFLPGLLQEHEARDLWWDCREYVYAVIRKQFGVAPSLVVPEVTMQYETALGRNHHRVKQGAWEIGAGKDASPSHASLRLTVAEVTVDHTEFLYAIADHLLPRLAKQGIRRYMPEVITHSDVTELGMKRKLDGGVHGDLHCASVCATHRFFPSEFWGGMRAWKYLADKAHGLGLEIIHWFAPHFSPRSPIFQQHPEYRMIDATGLPAAGGYGFSTLVAADWNTGIYKWVLNDLKRWKREGGLDGVFVDSFANLGMLPVNYSAAMRTNYAVFARLLGDLQRIGITSVSFECVSALGTGHFGIADPQGDNLEQDRAVAGQNDFAWWLGQEDMAGDCFLNVQPRQRRTADLERGLFRAMASRGYFNFYGCGLYDQKHILPNWWVRLNHLYNQALPYMAGQRRLLPMGAGVRWENAGEELIWTFKDWRITPVVPVRILRLEGNTQRACSDPVLPAWNVFRITTVH